MGQTEALDEQVRSACMHIPFSSNCAGFCVLQAERDWRRVQGGQENGPRPALIWLCSELKIIAIAPTPTRWWQGTRGWQLIGGGCDEASSASSRSAPRFQWQCADCQSQDNQCDGLYGLMRCVGCLSPSPALILCADIGLEVLWVPADGDCYYHSLLQDDRTRTSESTNVNDPGYIRALIELRTEAAKQLVTSDARLDIAQQRRVASASARRTRSPGIYIYI